LNVIDINLSDPASRARYDAFFESCADAFIQQSSLWADVISALGPDKPIFLLCNDGTQDVGGLPLYLYEHKHGNVLTSVPQPGPMGGVFCKSDLPAETKHAVYQALIARAEEIAKAHQCLSMTFITNPFQPDIELYKSVFAPTYIFENFTQSIPLKEVIADGRFTLKDYNRRSNLSRNIKTAHEADFKVEREGTVARLDEWYKIHCARHTEIGATPLRLDLFQNILRVLEPHGKAHLLLINKGADIASGCVYIHHRNVLDVFLLSMNTAFFELGPNFVNTEQSMLWAAQRGIHQYNWQSSPKRDTGVYRYKKQWGSVDISYFFVTKLYCTPERIKEIGLDTIKKEYPFHYVVPFGVFSAGFEQREFKK
jgi:hypothetical protein